MLLGVFCGRFGRISMFETDQPVRMHAHPQFNVMINVGDADGAYEVEAFGSCPLTRDRLILLDPWVAHAKGPTARVRPITVLALYMEPDWVRHADGLPQHRSIFPSPTAMMTPELRAATASLMRMLTGREPVAGEQIEAALQHTFRIVVDCYGTGASVLSPPEIMDNRLRRALVEMRRAAGTGIDLDEICRRVGLSRTRFYERFMVNLGLPPKVYADGLRLDAAIDRLARSDQLIGDIALDMGFSAQSHFARFFKEKTGFSPRVYRCAINDL